MEVEKEKIINKESIFCEKCRSMLLFNLYIDNKTIYSIYFCKECNKHYCNLCMNNHSFFLPLHKISEININLPYDKEKRKNTIAKFVKYTIQKKKTIFIFYIML